MAAILKQGLACILSLCSITTTKGLNVDNGNFFYGSSLLVLIYVLIFFFSFGGWVCFPLQFISLQEMHILSYCAEAIWFDM